MFSLKINDVNKKTPATALFIRYTRILVGQKLRISEHCSVQNTLVDKWETNTLFGHEFPYDCCNTTPAICGLPVTTIY